MLNPLKPPRPDNYGFLGDLALPNTQVDLPRPQMPKIEQPPVPDIMRAQFGAGDKQMVGSLLKAANGEDSGLVGVTPSFAARLLTSFGYPTTMDAWNGDQWADAINSHASDMNPLAILESLGTGMGY